jgi:hypothetical protein
MRALPLPAFGATNVCGQVFPTPAWWGGIVAGIVVIVVVLAVVRWMRTGRKVRRQPEPDLFVDVGQLDAAGPSLQGPRIEFYGTPVRLAVLVVAPAGRHGELPPAGVLPSLMDRLVPGLPNVVADHQPLICRWPAQLSTQGFAQSFFNQVALPGDRGKGTPWCSIAGKLQVGDRLFVVGLVCCASQSNGLSQVVVQHEGQWLDILRIRDK